MALNEVKPKSFLPSLLDLTLWGVIALVFLVAPWYYGLTRFRDRLLAESFLLSVGLVFIFFIDWGRFFRNTAGTIDRWIFFFLALGFLYVPLSALPYQSLLAFSQLASCVIFYGLTRYATRSERGLQAALGMICLSGFLYSSYGLLQYYGFQPRNFWINPDALASRYVNGSHFGVFLFFSFFAGLGLVFSDLNRTFRWAISGMLPVMGGALLLCRSRAVWGAFFASVLFFLWLVWKNRLLKGKTLWIILGLAGALVFLLAAQGGFGIIAQRVNELWHTKFYSVNYRFQLWEGAWQTILRRPWGWGLGTFSSILPLYRVQADRFFIDYAHNEFLQTGVDLGIVGILFLGGLISTFYIRGISFLKRGGASRSERVIGVSFLALWTGLVIESQFDFPLRIYATTLLFSGLLAMGARLFGPRVSGAPSGMGKPDPENRGPRKGPFFRPLCFVGVAFLLFVTGRQLLAQVHFEKGMRLDKDFLWKEALESYEKAVRLSPFYGDYHVAVGSLYHRKSMVSFGAKEKNNFRLEAIRAYQAAVRYQPFRSEYRFSLGRLYEGLRQNDRAKSEFRQALSLEPTNPQLVLEYGYFALRHLSVEEAIDSFEKLKGLSYRGAGSEFDPCEILKKCYGRTQKYADLRRVILDEDWRSHQCLGELMAQKGEWETVRGEMDLALELAKPSFQDAVLYDEHIRRAVAKFYLEHGRFEEAVQMYEKALREEGGDPRVRGRIEEVRQTILEKQKGAKTVLPLS